MHLRRYVLAILAVTAIYILVWIGKLPQATLTPGTGGSINHPTAVIAGPTYALAPDAMLGQSDRWRVHNIHRPITTGEDTLSKRLKRTIEICAEFNSRGTFNRLRLDGYVWSLPSHNVTYCVTAKIGSTFWKSVLRYVGHDNDGGTVTRLGDIGGLDVHYATLRHIQRYNIRSSASRARTSFTQTFMFSRDPYTRLWAAYIDKFVLPDFWGTNDSLSIIRHFRQNATEHARRCGHDVTFEEFLKYVAYTGTHEPTMNEHWTPLYRLCNPCLMRFDAIGRHENYSTDTREIIKITGLQNALENLTVDSDEAREKRRISETVLYNFELEEYAVKGCFDKVLVAKRLWWVFQFKGYIEEYIPFPIETINEFRTAFENNPISVFTHIVQGTRNGRIRTARARISQKNKMRNAAYSAIPRDVLLHVRDLFMIDFELFSYDVNPADLFGG